MKNWQIMGVITFLIIGTVLMSGCISTGSTSAAPLTPTPTSTVTLIPSRTFTSTPTPSSTPALKTVLFSDDLSQWKSEWDTISETSNGKIFYSGGSLHIRDNEPPSLSRTMVLNKNFNDFILDIDTKLVSGTIDNWQGVGIRASDGSVGLNYYDFSVSGDGYYGIQKTENGNLVQLAGPTRSGYIKTGIGQTNHLQVEADKNTLRFSVNGYLLTTITDNTFKEGTVTLSVNSIGSNSYSEVAYNNLVITTI